MQMSITSDVNGVKLVSDSAAPGNQQYYGTNTSGTKGFHVLPLRILTAGEKSGAMYVWNGTAWAVFPVPIAAGTYSLRCVVDGSGNGTISWV